METNILYNELLEAYAEAALNHAVAYLQEQLQIESGDFAGVFFCGEKGEAIKDILKDYIKAESDFKETA
jgi:hypothetical protein